MALLKIRKIKKLKLIAFKTLFIDLFNSKNNFIVLFTWKFYNEYNFLHGNIFFYYHNKKIENNIVFITLNTET